MRDMAALRKRIVSFMLAVMIVAGSFTGMMPGTLLRVEADGQEVKVIKEPGPKKLEYTGEAQELVTPGEASGGTMRYALGDSSNKGAWSTEIPKATNVGAYYVWFKAVSDDEQYSSEEKSVVATISKPADVGHMETDIKNNGNTPVTSIQGLVEEVAWGVATQEELDDVQNKGAVGRLWIEISNIDASINAGEKQLIDNQAASLNDAKVGMCFDISAYFQVDNHEKRKLSDLATRGVKVEVTVPAYLRSTGERTFYLVSVHNGATKIHGSTTGDKITSTLTQFSTFALLYSDGEKEEVFKTSVTIKQTADKIIVNWDKVDGVGKVEVFLAYCGTKYTKKPSKITRKRKVTVTKIRGKKLNPKRNFKMYLVAYDAKGNRIGRTLSCHFCGKTCKFTNPKYLKLSTYKMSLTVGESKKVTGKITYEDKKKKPLSEKHAARFRYVSDSPDIATVDKHGNIIGVSPGFTDVHVVCQNGYSEKVKVTVSP